MLEGSEGERPRPELTGFSTLLEGKGLFGSRTPKGEDPTWYPIQVMSEMQHDLAMRAYRNTQDKTLAEKLTAWKESIGKVEMAYEISAFPRLERDYSLEVRDKIRDAQEHPNTDAQEYPHRAPIKLNSEELSTLGKIARARGLSFDAEKRIYRYSELSTLRQAEHILADTSDVARIAKQNAQRAGAVTYRSQIDEEIRQRQEPWHNGSVDEPPTQSKPEK